jgi:ATP/maltotriose-dependent transcriptional regulator MalT
VLSRVGLALLAVQQGDVAVAEEQYAALQPLQGTIEWVIVGDRLLGLLALRRGGLEKAMGHFEAALTFCRKAGYRPELAWTCYDYAEGLLQGNRPDALEKARSLLDEALATTRELGMRPLMERAFTLREGAELQPPRAPAYPDGLSQREVEVLRLLARGLSNPQIAQELVISRKTAARHVSNIFAKTGVANRTEAGAYAARVGLLSW